MAASGSSEKRKRKFRSASYGDAVVASMRKLQQDDHLCDFTVSAQGKSIRVHKMLLAGMSEYFLRMLLGQMKESQDNHVDLQALTAESLQLIVDFLYSGTMQLDFDNLIEVLTASTHLQIPTALDLCSDYLVSLINFSNAEELLRIADTYSLTRVADYYTNKVLSDFEEFVVTDQFLNTSATQLVTYLSDDRLRVHSEFALMDPLARWFSHDASNRAQHVEEILRCVRFALMSDAQLMTLPQHWLSTKHPPAIQFINQGLKYHRDVKIGHPSNEALESIARMRAENSDLVFIHQGSSYKPFEVTSYCREEDKFFQLATGICGSRDCRITMVDNFVYICRVVDCGGGTLMNSLLRFDPRHLSLQELTPSRRLRIDPAVASIGKMLYVFGGTTEPYSVLDAVECYNVETNSWLELPSLPVPTHSLSAVTSGHCVYLSGGLEAQARSTPVTSLRRYNTTDRSWTDLSPMHCARRLHEMVALKDKLYVLGGMNETLLHTQTQIPIERYCLLTDQWTLLSGTLPGRAVGHFVSYQDAILSIGREHLKATEEEIWKYAVEEDAWTPFARVPRRSGLAGVSSTKLYINFHDERIVRHVISDKR